jgi:glutamate dehydrogenase
MNKLEEDGRLNRALEFLPSDAVVKERRKHKTGLLLPELAVLLAYTKMSLKQQLLDSDILEDSSFDHSRSYELPKNPVVL